MPIFCNLIYLLSMVFNMIESMAVLADQCAINVAAYLYYVEVKSRARLYDVAIFGESLAKGLVTTVFGYEDLISLNLRDGSYPAIDLATSNGKIAFQVTISGGSEKIESTLDIFMKHKCDETYSRLIFIILGDKQGRYESKKISENCGTFDFDPYRDIYDLRQLYDMLIKDSKPEKFQMLSNLIAAELGSNVRTLLVGYNRAEDNLGRLFSGHDVTPTLGVRAMQKFDIDRQIFCNLDQLNQRLTHDIANFLADEFAVSNQWVTGETHHIYETMPDAIPSTGWRRSLSGAYELIKKHYEKNERLSLVIPAHISFDDFETPYPRKNAEVEQIEKNNGGNPGELSPHYFIVAESENSFGVKRYRWLANEPLQHSKFGIYLLFLAAEIWRTVNERSNLIDVLTASYCDMRAIQKGELFLADILMVRSFVRNHADYIYHRNLAFATINVPSEILRKLHCELEIFVAAQRRLRPTERRIPVELQ